MVVLREVTGGGLLIQMWKTPFPIAIVPVGVTWATNFAVTVASPASDMEKFLPDRNKMSRSEQRKNRNLSSKLVEESYLYDDLDTAEKKYVERVEAHVGKRLERMKFGKRLPEDWMGKKK